MPGAEAFAARVAAKLGPVNRRDRLRPHPGELRGGSSPATSSTATPALLAADERERRTLSTDPGPRMGLQQALHQQRRPGSGPAGLPSTV